MTTREGVGSEVAAKSVLPQWAGPRGGGVGTHGAPQLPWAWRTRFKMGGGRTGLHVSRVQTRASACA